MKKSPLILAAAGLAILAGCQSQGPGGGPVAPRPTGFQGTWIGATGGVSTLSGGSFQTVALDTGERLSEGRYFSSGADQITMSGVSLARKRRGLPAEISFNCRQVTTDQLNCTSASGSTFVLTRRLPA
ncbi:MAG: hypothetical protein ABJM38_02130 [Nitratireductor sp.]